VVTNTTQAIQYVSDLTAAHRRTHEA